MIEQAQLYQQLLDRAPVGIILVDREGNILEVNQRLVELLGSPSIEATKAINLLQFPPLIESGVSADFSRCIEEGTADIFERSYRSKWGKETCLRYHLYPVRNREGQIVGAQAIVEDVSPRKRAEQALRHRVAMERKIAAISQWLLQVRPEETDEAILWALELIGRFVGVDRSYVFLFDEDGATMSNTHEWCAKGIPLRQESQQKIPTRWLPWWMKKMSVLEHIHLPCLEKLPEEASREKKILQGQGILSLVVVPLVDGESLLGFLGFDALRKEQTWSEEDIALLRVTGELFVRALNRKWSQEALQESERMLSTLIQNLPGMTYRSLNLPHQSLSFLSEGCFELTGYLPKDFLQGRIQYNDLIHPDDREDVCREMQTAFGEERPFLLHYRIVTASHQEKWVWERGCGVYDEEGEIRAVEGFVCDITERKQVELEKETLAAQLQHQQRLESIGTLASSVAHEINNPLSVVMNYAQVLEELLPSNALLQEYAHNIFKESQRIAKMVRNLLAFSRKEQETPEFESLPQLIEETLSLLRDELQKDNIHLKIDIPPQLPLLCCQGQEIQQVLLNLLTNARDALNQRYPVADKDKMILLRLREREAEEKQWLCLTVEDHGSGIPPELLSKIFDPFFTTKPKNKGTGLGLSISYDIIERHKGRLRVESQPEQYTRFLIDLPLSDSMYALPEGPPLSDSIVAPFREGGREGGSREGSGRT